MVAGRLVGSGHQRLRQALPSVWGQLEETRRTLEALFQDAQDFEFTLQCGKLYLLQSRAAKRTPWAAVRIAIDQVEEGLITPAEAMARLAEIELDSVSRTRLAHSASKPLTHAQVAGIGVVNGAIAPEPDLARSGGRPTTWEGMLDRVPESGD